METHTNHTLKANSIYPTTTKNRVSFGFIEHEKKYTIWNLVIQQRTHTYTDTQMSLQVVSISWQSSCRALSWRYSDLSKRVKIIWLSNLSSLPFFLSLDSSVGKVDMWLCVNSYGYEENKSNTIESFEIGNRPMNEKKKSRQHIEISWHWRE